MEDLNLTVENEVAYATTFKLKGVDEEITIDGSLTLSEDEDGISSDDYFNSKDVVVSTDFEIGKDEFTVEDKVIKIKGEDISKYSRNDFNIILTNFHNHIEDKFIDMSKNDKKTMDKGIYYFYPAQLEFVTFTPVIMTNKGFNKIV